MSAEKGLLEKEGNAIIGHGFAVDTVYTEQRWWDGRRYLTLDILWVLPEMGADGLPTWGPLGALFLARGASGWSYGWKVAGGYEPPTVLMPIGPRDAEPRQIGAWVAELVEKAATP